MMMKMLLVCVLATLALAARHDPECDMNAAEMIRHNGYHAEEHDVTTEDGYILTMQRIPYGRSETGDEDVCKPIIFMQHGLECDSTNWISNLPNNSAAFMFADAGFDVWLGNMRGNTYGKNHKSKSVDRKSDFWEFSWDEMAQFDLPAMIDFVLKTTGQKDLYYMGHSQGTLTMFSKLSMDKEFSKKIRKFFALAPIGTVKHIKGALKALSHLQVPFDVIVDWTGRGEFTPNRELTDLFAKWVCGTGNFLEGLCENVMFLIAGPETSNQFNSSRTEIYLAHTPAGTSTQNIEHWLQMVKSGTVSRFDYGKKENREKYNQDKPPTYEFKNIRTDMYLYWSDDDYLADPKDINDYLINNLNPNYFKQNNHLPHYNHLDFIWGTNAAFDIYQPIIDLLKKEMGGEVKCI